MKTTNVHAEYKLSRKRGISESNSIVVVVVVTVTLQSLVNQAVKQGAAVVAEGRASVGVIFKLVLRPIILGRYKSTIYVQVLIYIEKVSVLIM